MDAGSDVGALDLGFDADSGPMARDFVPEVKRVAVTSVLADPRVSPLLRADDFAVLLVGEFFGSGSAATFLLAAALPEGVRSATAVAEAAVFFAIFLAEVSAADGLPAAVFLALSATVLLVAGLSAAVFRAADLPAVVRCAGRFVAGASSVPSPVVAVVDPVDRLVGLVAGLVAGFVAGFVAADLLAADLLAALFGLAGRLVTGFFAGALVAAEARPEPVAARLAAGSVPARSVASSAPSTVDRDRPVLAVRVTLAVIVEPPRASRWDASKFREQ